MRSVFPLETRSTIASASPRRGATSTEPVTSTSSTSTPRSPSSVRASTRVHGRDAEAGEVRRADSAVDSCGTAASSVQAPKPSRSSSLTRAPRSTHEVGAGDAAVDDAVLDVLGDVRGAHEQHLDRRVPARERERPLAGLLGAEAGVLEQRDGRLAQPALRRDRDPQARREGLAPRSSASR